VVEWDGTLVRTTQRLLLRTFRRDDLPHYAVLNAFWVRVPATA
jgi:hypothetical protein